MTTMDSSREILWQPSTEDITSSRLYLYRQWLTIHHGIDFSDYESLWQWSVDQPEVFWETIAAFFKVKFHSPYTAVLSGGLMP